MSSLDSLTPAQVATLRHMQSVCDLNDDATCIHLLTAHRWDIEAAVTDALAISAINTQTKHKANSARNIDTAQRTDSAVSLSPSSPTTPTPLTSLLAAPSASASSSVPRQPQSAQTHAADSADNFNAQSFMSRRRGGADNGDGGAERPLSASAAPSLARWIEQLPFGIGWIASAIATVVARLLESILPTQVLAAVTGGGVSVADSQAQFVAQFTAEYPRAPTLVNGSYVHAARAAKAQRKLLLIYIHSFNEAQSQHFVRQTLCDEAAVNFINENFIFFASSLAQTDTYRLTHALNMTALPFLALLAPHSTQLALLYRSNGRSLDTDSLIAHLMQAMDTHSNMLAETQRRQRQTTDTRSIIDEQNREYQEALEKDRQQKIQREELMRIEAEEKRRREEEEQKLIQAAAEAEDRQLRRVELLQSERQRKLASLPAEPAPAATVAVVGVRLSAGKKIQRRFELSETLNVVFDWIDGNEDDNGPDAKWVQRTGQTDDASGDRRGALQVVSNFPRQIHRDGQKSLSQLGLGKQILLIVEVLEDEEEKVT